MLFITGCVLHSPVTVYKTQKDIHLTRQVMTILYFGAAYYVYIVHNLGEELYKNIIIGYRIL